MTGFEQTAKAQSQEIVANDSANGRTNALSQQALQFAYTRPDRVNYRIWALGRVADSENSERENIVTESELGKTAQRFIEGHGTELRQFHSRLDEVFASFLKRPEIPNSDKTQIIGMLEDISDGRGLRPQGIQDQNNRNRAVAGIIDNLGEPFHIDQGAHPTCVQASQEQEFYSGQGGDNPAAVSIIVKHLQQVILTGSRIDETIDGKSLNPAPVKYMFYSKVLTPDYEAMADQGTDDYRNFASQLFEQTTRTPYPWLKGLSSNVYAADGLLGTPDENARALASILEKQASTLITIHADSKFNELMSGSLPFAKDINHAANIYRQKDLQGKPEFDAEGKPLFLFINQAGKALNIRDLTEDDLAKLWQTYDSHEGSLPGRSSPIPGREKMHDTWWKRQDDLRRRRIEMRHRGEL